MKPLEEIVREYFDLLNSPADAWGAHKHPVYGMSHNMLYAITKQYGKEATDKACHEEIGRRTVAAYVSEGLGE